jgi:hypothetical protein
MMKRLALLFLAAALPVLAAKTTVCTVTVNSSDERDTFRRYLPESDYEFVELVEHGRTDWLDSACRRGVQCDVLIVSGHFAGTEFYSSRFDAKETLPVDEIERVQCSQSCPGLFGKLKEVYLFGCDTLKPEPVKSASPEIIRGLMRSGVGRAEAESFARALSDRYGESSRGLMRRVFPDVPVIYGFSSLAPYGRVAGPMLSRYFEAGAAGEVGRGEASARLLSLFGPASMTVTSGMRASEANADYRAEACRFVDDRDPLALKVANAGRILGDEMPRMRMSFDRVEKFFASLGEDARRDAGVTRVLAQIAADDAARQRFLGAVHDTEDPALRTRMIALARQLEWLSAESRDAELVRMIHDVMATPSMGFGEVDLICTLNKDRELDAGLRQLESTQQAQTAAQAAALACLGSEPGRERVLRALASSDEQEVQIAQAFLRHRPLTDSAQIRSLAYGVARMSSTGAQARAIETLARQRIEDNEVRQELLRVYAKTSSVNVQRAVAEVFLRSGVPAEERPRILSTLRQHRLRSGSAGDTIDTLVGQLQPR